MIGEALNHLWQSTAFAVVVALLAITFRHNRAHVRYWLWFSASVKFLIPFTLLISLGSHLRSTDAAHWLAQNEIALTVAQISQLRPDTWSPFTRDVSNWRGLTVLGVWGCGCGLILLIRLQMWRRIRAVVRASTPFDSGSVGIRTRVQVRSARGSLEPGVVRWLRPILLIPSGIEKHLTRPQLQAVFAHELCHVRRGDNFTAGIHMVSEAVFWCHPLVWWIGARLIAEREQACDEEVLLLGSNPRVYAEGIVKTCELYAESRRSCLVGVSGSDLTKRIEAIMRNQRGTAVNPWKKVVLGTASVLAVAIPVGVGVLNAPRPHAQSQATGASSAAFKVAQVDGQSFCCPDYLGEMIDRIRVNWVQRSAVDGSNVVSFTIQRDGRIVDVVLEKPSGSRDLDQKSRQALLVTKSVNPLPAGFPNPTLTVHLNFQYQR